MMTNTGRPKHGDIPTSTAGLYLAFFEMGGSAPQTPGVTSEYE
jgi:hypothetical protein